MKKEMEKAILLYKEGKSIDSASKTAGVSFPGLHYHLKKLKIIRNAKEASHKSYTPESLEEALRLYANGKSMKEVNRVTKVSLHTLRHKIKELKIVRKKIPKSNPLLDKSVELYNSGLSTLKVKEITGVSIGVLSRQLKKLDLIRSNKINSRKYTIDHTFFKKIDNEKKAYWLGFIYADGYVSRRKNQKCLGIALHTKDEKHLRVFKKDINATYKINRYITTSFGVKTTFAKIFITSDQLFDDLVDKGVFEKKTLILKFPKDNIVPVELQNHFLRGYFDGDGSFSKSKDGFYSFKLCGTKEFLIECQKILGVTTKLEKRKKDKKNNWSFAAGGRLQVKRVGNCLYKNSTVHLERKYKRYTKCNF